MSLDIFFKEDIANALRSANHGSGNAALVVQDAIKTALENNLDVPDIIANNLRIYRQGYKDALDTIALAFGIHVPRNGL